MLGYACWYLTKAEVRNSEAFWSFFYRWFSLKWPASMQIYWNKRKLLHKKRFNSHRIFLVHRHGRRSIVLEDQDGGRDVTWSALYLVWFSLCSSLFWELRDKRVDLEKFTILALKPRSHVRILIYRMWAIGSCISLRVSKIRRTRARRRCSSCSITKASKGEKMQVEIWDWEIKGLFAGRWGNMWRVTPPSM